MKICVVRAALHEWHLQFVRLFVQIAGLGASYWVICTIIRTKCRIRGFTLGALYDYSYKMQAAGLHTG
ncbi:hypothetical protein A7K91_03535 [Paenibacillus oryzae]|uniref:Uncharacterized protein n=1 Tax=Paenibacillus oryzae TaxID=1844972 RepID=A0A1A5YLN5_9BACL|nr:hypothetical protein A7K91_03535 [Paenibacillus oryzae]